jgi:integrase
MHRTSQGGTYRLDRVFPGVGRIVRASGATTKGEFQKRNDLLSRLYDRGRLDLLTAIRDGTYTVTEVYAADRDGQLARLTGDAAVLRRSLWATVEAWIGRPLWGDAAEQWKGPEPGPTRKRYAVSFLKLRKHLHADATVGDLGAVDWPALLETWGGSGSDWNHLRRAISHFLAVQLGDVHHPWRRQVVTAMPRRAERSVTPDLPPALFWRIVDAAPEHVRAAYVTICALGLRVGEYLRLRDTDLLPHTQSVRIPGTKTEASATVVRVDERLWPWIKQGVPSPLAYKWLRTYWKRALKAAGADETLRLHDLRHAYGQWLSDAGVPEARIQSGLRHATAGMTRRYAMQRDKGEASRTMADVMLVKSA